MTTLELLHRISRLGITDPASEVEAESEAKREVTRSSGDDVYSDANDLYGDDMPVIPPGTPDLDVILRHVRVNLFSA